MNDDELTRLLEQLPEEVTPPPLPERIYAVPTERPRSPAWIGVAVLLAASLLFWLRPSAPEPVVLLAGDSVLDGTLEVLVPGSRIELDGRARITVEPSHTPLREIPQNLEDPMHTRDLLTGLAGVALTVVVYEGRALVHAEATEPHAVSAGETRSFRAPTAPSSPSVARAPHTSPDERIQALEAELMEAKRALGEQRFATALLEGQLKAGQGEPVPWPVDGVPADFRPDVFEARLAEKIAGIDDLEIDRVDCSEYPCLATLHHTGDAETMEWAEQALAELKPWFDSSWEQASLTANNSGFEIDGQRESFMTLGVHGSPDDAVLDERLRWRMDQTVGQLGEELRQDLSAAP